MIVGLGGGGILGILGTLVLVVVGGMADSLSSSGNQTMILHLFKIDILKKRQNAEKGTAYFAAYPKLEPQIV